MNNAVFPGVRPPMMGQMGLPPNLQTAPNQGPMVPTGQRTPVSPPPVVSIPIQPGDTLSAIAKRFGTTVSTLQYMNGIKNPDEIFAGKNITVPNPQHRAIPQVPQLMQGMTNPSMNLQEQGGLESVAPIEELMGGLPARGAAAAGALLGGGVLSKLIPRTPRQTPAGRVDFSSPNFPGALSNVMPVSNNPVGNAKMMLGGRSLDEIRRLQQYRNRPPMNQDLSPDASVIRPNTIRDRNRELEFARRFLNQND